MKLIEKSQNFNLNRPINVIQPILSPFVLLPNFFCYIIFLLNIDLTYLSNNFDFFPLTQVIILILIVWT